MASTAEDKPSTSTSTSTSPTSTPSQTSQTTTTTTTTTTLNPKNPTTPSGTTTKPTGLWNSLKPHGSIFTGALTPSASTPGATTPGLFSFDEPFGDVTTAGKGVDAEVLRARMDHVHDGGLEGGFHHGDDHE